jgi:hypothetical protein
MMLFVSIPWSHNIRQLKKKLLVSIQSSNVQVKNQDILDFRYTRVNSVSNGRGFVSPWVEGDKEWTHFGKISNEDRSSWALKVEIVRCCWAVVASSYVCMYGKRNSK